MNRSAQGSAAEEYVVATCGDGAGAGDISAAASSDPAIQWLLATAAGDKAAFRNLYDATNTRLFSIALLLLKRRDAAEDVLQDAYVNIWKQAQRYDPQRGAPLPWMSQIVRHAAIDRLRKDRVMHEDLAEHQNDITVAPAPVQQRIDLLRGLATLRPMQRAAFLLACQHGYTAQQIAVRFGAPLGTAKSWIRIGKERLRLALQEDVHMIR